MNPSLTSVSAGITPGQQKLITRIIIDVADSKSVQAALARLSKVDAERLKGSPEFASSIRDFVLKQIATLSVSNQFANEEVESHYGYLSGYTMPKGITKQTNCLRELIPGVGFADEKLATKPLPAGAEGYGAIPRWQTMGKTYSEALQKVMDLLKKVYKGHFTNLHEDVIDEKHVRMSFKTAAWFEKMAEEQKGYDILVVPIQFGINHRGRSIRRALEVMTGGEFGLDAFSVGILLLTHPERLQNLDDLWIDCAGTEWAPGGDGVFSKSVCWYFDDGKLGFYGRSVGTFYNFYGSASGFGLVSQGDS